MAPGTSEGLSTLEYHVLLALADGPRYGYAITEAVQAESRGALSPKAGSLYRVIARLLTWGLAEEAPTPRDDAPHPGRARRYYALTPAGRDVLSAETRRLKHAVALAERRLRTIEGGA